MPGSGTRVFAAILRLSGCYIGASLSDALDAREFLDFADRWVDPYVESWANGTPLAEHARMAADLDDFVRRHTAPMDDPQGAWGWKAPRSICFVPFLFDRLPGMRFVHVVRDGRDVAFKFQGRPRTLPEDRRRRFSMGQATLLDPASLDGPLPPAMIGVWARLNILAAEHGQERGESYLRVRLEDLCEHPTELAHRLLRFMLGAEPSAETVSAAAALVERPPSLGRWRREDPADLAPVVNAGGAALERFGYTA
jgi:hypothetical protein